MGQGINILFITDGGLGVVAVRPSRSLVEMTKLPDNLMLMMEPSGAFYSVEAIYRVGLPLDSELEMARVSVGQNLGVALTGVVKAGSSLTIAALREALMSATTETNLGLVDRYFLIKDLTTIMERKSSLSSSLPKGVFDSNEEPDGKMVLRFNSAVFIWSRNRWVVDEVLSEAAELTVVNASTIEGKAKQVARQIETAGGRVVEVGLAKKGLTTRRCLLLGKVEAYPQTAKFITSAFACKVSPDLELGEYVDQTRAASDLVVVLGRN